MLCPRQKSFKDALASTAFSLNLLLHVSKFETIMSIDSFFIEQATFAAHLFIVPGDLLLSRSIVPKCNIKWLGCPCEGFSARTVFSHISKLLRFSEISQPFTDFITLSPRITTLFYRYSLYSFCLYPFWFWKDLLDLSQLLTLKIELV